MKKDLNFQMALSILVGRGNTRCVDDFVCILHISQFSLCHSPEVPLSKTKKVPNKLIL